MKQEFFKYKGQSVLSLILGFSMIALLISFAVSISLKLNPIGLTLAAILIVLAVYLITKIILDVRFLEDNLKVRYYGGKIKTIPYDRIKKCYFNQEGFLPVHVYVVRYSNSDGKEKNVTFYCSKSAFDKVSKFLLEKEPKIKIVKN